jgi:predicted P-loop ATPase
VLKCSGERITYKTGDRYGALAGFHSRWSEVLPMYTASTAAKLRGRMGQQDKYTIQVSVTYAVVAAKISTIRLFVRRTRLKEKTEVRPAIAPRRFGSESTKYKMMMAAIGKTPARTVACTLVRRASLVSE